MNIIFGRVTTSWLCHHITIKDMLLFIWAFEMYIIEIKIDWNQIKFSLV